MAIATGKILCLGNAVAGGPMAIRLAGLLQAGQFVVDGLRAGHVRLAHVLVPVLQVVVEQRTIELDFDVATGA
jgi:hypothetical protein